MFRPYEPETPAEIRLVNMMDTCLSFIREDGSSFWTAKLLDFWDEYHRMLEAGRLDTDPIGDMTLEADEHSTRESNRP